MEEVEFCSFCGRVISKEYHFCPYCGTAAEDVPDFEALVSRTVDKAAAVSRQKTYSRLETMETALGQLEKELDQFLEGHRK